MRRFLETGETIVAPNFKDGEKFFLVIDNRIIAARLHKSFYDTARQESVRADAVLWGLVETSVFVGVRVGVRCQEEYMCLYVKGKGVWLHNPFTGEEFPVFDSIEDARKNRRSTRIIDLCKEELCNKGIESACTIKDGNDAPLISYTCWRLSEDGHVRLACDYTQTLVWGRKGGLYLSDREKILAGGFSTRELAEMASDKAKASEDMEVCDFPDGEESEDDSPVLVVMGMISGVLDLIIKELEKYEGER